MKIVGLATNCLNYGSKDFLVASDWRTTTLGEVVDMTSGGTPSTQVRDYWDGTIPWVSAKDMKTWLLRDTEDHVTKDGLENGTRLAPRGAVLLLTRGMTLLNDVPICIAERPVAFNQDVKALTAKGALTQEYLPYLLLAYKNRLLDMVDLAGHGTGRLNSDELRSLDVVIPPQRQQLAIASLLRSIDSRIDLTQSVSKVLEVVARTIFKSWFVDFDPTRMKSEGRDPGVPKHIADLFSDRFEESEVGAIPAGWRVCSISEAADIMGGSTPSTRIASYWDEGVHHWVTPKDLSALASPALLDTNRLITSAGLAQVSSGLLPQGTVLLSSRAPIGYTAITYVPVAINQGFIAMRPREHFSSAFLLLWAESSLDVILSFANGSTFPEISKSAFRKLNIIDPGKKLASLFDRTVSPLFEGIVAAQRQSQTLRNLVGALLPQLISGQSTLTE